MMVLEDLVEPAESHRSRLKLTECFCFLEKLNLSYCSANELRVNDCPGKILEGRLHQGPQPVHVVQSHQYLPLILV